VRLGRYAALAVVRQVVDLPPPSHTEARDSKARTTKENEDKDGDED